MARQTKVIDASVIVKWFLNEKGKETAISIRDDHVQEKISLVIPEMAFIEVLNALKWKFPDTEFLRRSLKILYQLQLRVEPLTPSLLDSAIKKSVSHKLTLYDALYSAIADLHQCPLITADKKLATAMGIEPL